MEILVINGPSLPKEDAVHSKVFFMKTSSPPNVPFIGNFRKSNKTRSMQKEDYLKRVLGLGFLSEILSYLNSLTKKQVYCIKIVVIKTLAQTRRNFEIDKKYC